MSPRVVQQGSSSDVVIAYHMGEPLDQMLAASFPDATIFNETGITYHDPNEVSPPPQAGRLILVGWSAGCQAIRVQLQRGVVPAAIIACDGIHGSYDVWKRYVEMARSGQVVMAITHSQVPGVQFPSTTEMAERLTGFVLDKFGPPSNPAVHSVGKLIVYSAEGNDAEAHKAQVRVVFPIAASAVMTALNTGEVPTGDSEFAPTGAQILALLAGVALGAATISIASSRKP